MKDTAKSQKNTNLAGFTGLAELNERIKRKTINPFPFDHFSGLAKELQRIPLHNPTNEHFVGGTFLFVLSVAIGNRYKIKVKTDYNETAVVWICVVGSAGSRKSFLFQKMLKPIYDQDGLQYEKYLNEYEINTGAKWKQTLVTDVTIEAIAEIMQNNPRGIGLYIDELKALFYMFGRYNKGGGVEQEFFKSMFSNIPINVSRKKSKPVHINSPNMPIGGTIQPELLNHFTASGREKDGFTDRFLFSFVPRHEPFFTDAEKERHGVQIPQTLKLIKEVLENDELRILDITEPGRILLRDKFNELETLKTKDRDNQGLFAKLQVYIYRFALLLQVVDDYSNARTPTHVTEHNARGACVLSDYFTLMGVKAREAMTEEPFEKLHLWQQELYDLTPDTPFQFKECLAIMNTLSPELVGGIQEQNRPKVLRRFLSKTDFFTRIRFGRYQKR